MTLEDDVAAHLREVAARTGKPLRAVVNEALRAGLTEAARPARGRFQVHARDLGLRPGIDLDDIEGVIERLEGPLHQ